MIFHSLVFLAFLAVVLPAYHLLGRRGQNALLLAASAVFYGWVHPWFLALLVVSTLTDYACGRGITERPAHRRRFIALSLVVNLGMLGLFKYFGFFVENVDAVLQLAGLGTWRPGLDLVLPVGISFYTFQTLGYTLDVARGKVKARTDLLDYAVFVTFFPQLVAGPIERAGNLLPQVERPRRFDPVLLREGGLLMVQGLFKKVVIADHAGATVDRVFSLSAPDFPTLWVGVLAFGVQIYADFSAYTDLARGTARMLGFELMENFNRPYMSQGPGEFWRRWHISLSQWLRDYVYVPLGGSRGGRRRWARNVLIVFAVSGLWHGASWNFVLWGVYWGVLVVAGGVLHRRTPVALRDHAVTRLFRVVVTFALAHIGWLMFRETDAAQLWRALGTSPFDATRRDWRDAAYLGTQVLLVALPLSVLAVGRSWWDRLPGPPAERAVAVRVLGAAVLFIAVLMLRSERSPDFIYFQF